MASITATSQGREGTATITVPVVAVAAVDATPPMPSIVVGGTVHWLRRLVTQGAPLRGR